MATRVLVITNRPDGVRSIAVDEKGYTLLEVLDDRCVSVT